MFSTHNVELSTEMIQPQHNDSIVNILNKYFMDLAVVIKSNNLTGNRVFKNRESSTIIKHIDNAIYERFGLNIKSIYSKTTPLGIFTVPPKNMNILKNNHIDFYDLVKLTYKKDTVPDEKVYDYEQQEEAVLTKWVKSVDELNDKLEKDNIIIDLQKAKIYNLPKSKDYTLFMVTDYAKLMSDLNLTNTEVTAAVLHEVGHAFTHIEYSYRTVKNTTLIVDSILDTIENKNKSSLTAIKLAYKNFGSNDNIDDVNNVATAYIKLADKYIKENMYMGYNRYSETDGEALADNFATYFDVGSDLTIALDKLHEFRDSYFNNINEAYALSFNLIMLLTLLSLTGLVLIAGITVVIMITMSLIAAVITGGGLANGSTYDIDYDRFKRIKNNIIRVIRTDSNLDKNTIKLYLNQLEDIDKTMALVKDKEQVTMMNKIMRVITPHGRKLADAKELDQVIEQLINNELYVQEQKLKTLV